MPLSTFDVDICCSREPVNLERLAAVLIGVGATLRGAPSGPPVHLDARTLRNGDSFTFLTTLGALDILGTPAGTDGYPDLARSAVTRSVAGHAVRVASIDDLIRMRRAAGRTKDLLALDELGALRARLDAEPVAG